MRLLRGVVQYYAWGDTQAIPDLLGVPADGRPWAEWWVGTHPAGPATFDDGTPLRSVSGELPYLLKLLAAAQPLSLQTHPDTATAQAGFRRENDLGIDLTDPSRIYRDPFAKPEVLVALTEFDALCGFRPEDATADLLHGLGLDDVAAQLLDDGLATVVGGLYRRSIDAAPIVRACSGAHTPEAELVTRLEAAYPGDPSVAVTLFLNRVHLHPGEAIYHTPGNLHAYLDGLGVEVMGASDNVVRGGLTPKHVDVDELLRVLRFEALVEPVVTAVATSAEVWHYPTPGAPFEVRRIELHSSFVHTATRREVLLCTAGSTSDLAAGQCAYLQPGERIETFGTAILWNVTEV